MRIIAQHGFGPKDKIARGVEEGLIDGAILSPRYYPPERMEAELSALNSDGCAAAMDPEFFATDFISHPMPNLGALEEWNYFRRPRRADLISGRAVSRSIRRALEAQIGLDVEYLIAPNIYVRRADSIDTAVALSFLSETKAVSGDFSDKPVYGTLCIHRDALLDTDSFRDVLDSLTGIENPPDGYYLIVGSSELQSTGNHIRSDLAHAEVIASMMYANHVLSINGADVINGYCFLMAPLLAACGAGGAASGWFSGLRKFCIDRYAKTQGGGRPPNVRYFSIPLLSHVTQTDLDAFRAVDGEVMNGLDYDQVYREGEPSRTEEAMQSWEALKSAADQFALGECDLDDSLAAIGEHIDQAVIRWRNLRAAGLSSEVEPNLERLDAMREGIELFKEWAELT